MAKPLISLKARALRYLSQREHSRLELERKLARYAAEGDDVLALLDILEKSKLLSAERFSESLVRRRAQRFGNHRIFAELQSHGLNPNDLTEIKADLSESEAARARDVLERKFPEPPKDALARAKMTRFLLQRGFSQQAVRAALKSQYCADADDSFPS